MKIEYTETTSPRRFGARGIALLYAGLGFTWILLTDVTLALLGDQGLESAAPQTAKGLLFVSLSAVVVYGLVSRSTPELQSARAALERANSERAIYDRILRHNFRNGLQVVGGNAELALGAEGDERTEYIRNVEEGCDRLLDLCRDAREFSALIDSDPEPRPVDLAERLREAAAVVDDYPEATLDLDVPPSVPAMAVDSIDVAFRHALENACQHAGDDPHVVVTVAERGDRAEVRVADSGEGVPESERAALDADTEAPLRHTSSLGLRVIQWLVDRSGGDLPFEDDGSTLRLSFRQTETHKVKTDG
jgi:signal transduction histidine kinase